MKLNKKGGNADTHTARVKQGSALDEVVSGQAGL